MAERSYRWLFWTLVVLGATVDLGSKYGVFAWLHGDHLDPRRLVGEYEVVPGVFQLHAQFTGARETGTGVGATLRTLAVDDLPRVNQGALFGLGNTYQHLANTLFAVISLAAAVAIAYWSTLPTTARDGTLCAALGLILAGTLGNLFDRVVFQGVRDFLYFYWIEWPVFNVADCCLVCGAGLLLLQAFLARPVPATETPAAMSLAAGSAEAN